MRGEATGDPPGPHLRPDFFDPVLAVQVQHIDGEFHEEAVHGFAGRNPQPVARSKTCVFQQSSTALRAGISDFSRIRQHDVTSDIADVNFQTSRYNTIPNKRAVPY